MSAARDRKGAVKGSGNEKPADPERQVAESVRSALRAVGQTPEDMGAWERLEAAAVAHETPATVTDAYRAALRQPHPAALLRELGERAVRFHQEWLADQPTLLLDILNRILEIEPTADWALKRLIVALTLQEQWDPLLAAYDHALGAVTERGRRVQLLEEAAGVAKDFVGNADRAIGYLQKLFALKPGDWQVAGALERLLERQERWGDLVASWRARIEGAPPDEARGLRLRIAVTQLEKLNAPDAALAEARRLLEEPADDAAAVDLGVRLVALPKAPVALRLAALRLVEARHDRSGRAAEALAIVRVGLSFAQGVDLAALHQDAANRLEAAGAGREAADHLSALMGLAPGDVDVQDQLRRLSAELGDFGPYARGLTEAAEKSGDGRRRVALLLETGQVHERLRGEAEAAIDSYARAAAEPAAEAPERLQALRRLEELLDQVGRDAARADVLDSLAALAPRTVERRADWGALARVASRLGDVDRASAAWERCLNADGADREALDGLADLLAGAERWRPLVEVLRRRMTAGADRAQRREDLQRIAVLQATKLGDPAAAIESWFEHEQTFGPSVTGVDALADLLTAEARWADLGELLTQTATRDRARAATLAARLGDACRLHLDTAALAAGWYTHALLADPTHAGAREGLMALAAFPESRAVAVSALQGAARATDDWQLSLAILAPRLAAAEDASARATALREAAGLWEHRANDRAAALAALCRALPLAPDDRELEGEALRLADATGDFGSLAVAAAAAVAALPAGARRRVEWLALRGDICESRLGDGQAALEAYAEALEIEPERLDLRRLVVRAAGRTGHWTQAARALLSPIASEENRRDDLLPLAETVAAAAEGWSALAKAVTAALPQAGLAARSMCAVENRVADWHAGKREDQAGAEAALVRALGHMPDDLPTLQRLAEIRRAARGEALFETLLRIAARTPADLDALAEATEIARDVPLDDARIVDTAGRLADQAAGLLRRGGRSEGARAPGAAAELALETLVATYLARGKPEDCQRAITVQLDGATLPLPAEITWELRRAAAGVAEQRLGDRAQAITIRRAMADERPDDVEAAEALASLYAAEDRLVELAELRRRHLERATEPARRLGLRLEIERLGAVLEARSDRVTLLRANLADQAGHAATVDAIAQVLEQKSRHAELCDVYEEQASRVEDQGEGDVAARLWTRMAALAETPLGDRPRAIRGHERAATLAPTAASLDALGRLCMELGDAEAAARWLDRRLTMADDAEAPEVALRLARAYLACDRRHRAVACLERVLERQPRASDVLGLLAELYRTAAAWEPLAELLTGATTFIADRKALLATAREAHRLFRDELHAPARAVPALERAVAAAPDDAELSMALAVGLTAAGRLDEARALLQRLLPATRRSPDRAAIHLQLGRVAGAEGDHVAALAALEQAAGVDIGNPEILALLGETARAAGQNDRAERAYRGLLMLLRRSDGAAPPASVSVVDALLALYELAAARGEAAQAAEVLDSAFEAAAHDAPAFARLRERLGERGELGALAAALEKRAAAVKTPEAQAEAWREIAEVRAQSGDGGGAFDALLHALQAIPADGALHDRARSLAREAGLTERYLGVVEAVVDRRRGRDDGPLVARLLLQAGDIVEKELADPPRALTFYRRASEIGDLSAEAASALARVGAACDPAERDKALDRLKVLAREAPAPDQQADALYRLAEAQLGAAETREEGLASLSAAMERDPAKEASTPRALGIVRDAVVPTEDLHKVLPLYERLARASGDERMLLDCLERRAATSDATIETAREGYDLAVALHEDERAEALLVRVVELGRARPGAAAEATWGLLERAKRRRAAGDLDGAHRCLAEALEVGDGGASLPMLRELAREATERNEPAVEARIYETLRARTPTEPQLLAKLLDLYTRADDRASLTRLVTETLEQLADPQERNQVRMRLVRFLLGRDASDRGVVETLRDVLMDDADHDEASALLGELYERAGDEGLLAELLEHRRRTLAARGDGAGLHPVTLKLAALLTPQRPDDALEALRDTLEHLPGDAALVEAVLALLPSEAGDPRGPAVEEVLASQPNQDEIRAAREARYRAAEMWEPLANLLVESAEAGAAPAQAAAQLSEAAHILKTRMFDFARAVDLLRRARALDPANVSTVRDLAASLVDLGETQKALSEVLTACRAPGLTRDVRAQLLRVRAEMLIDNKQRDAALSVLLEALAYSSGAGKQEVVEMIDRLRGAAAAGTPQVVLVTEDTNDITETGDPRH